jgi:hypothetical protein
MRLSSQGDSHLLLKSDKINQIILLGEICLKKTMIVNVRTPARVMETAKPVRTTTEKTVHVQTAEKQGMKKTAIKNKIVYEG